MVGLVIVSHSHALAEAVRELAEQVGQGRVALATAGGVDERTLGTNPERVARAIQKVSSPDGVLVLVDLGSAIMSAEMALELLPDQEKGRVLVCEAPLVEGAVAATALIAAGASLREAADEAIGALEAKRLQLRPAERARALPTQQERTRGRQERALPRPEREPVIGNGTTTAHSGRVVVSNALGLHARPAAQLVQVASRFKSRIRVRNVSRDTGFVSARSLNAVALLDARRGDELVIEAEGPDAVEAVEGLVALVASGFGEPAVLPEGPAEPHPREFPEGSAAQLFWGIGASPGVALGPAVHLRPQRPDVRRTFAEGDPEEELRRLEAARKAVAREVTELARSVRSSMGPYQAAIFDAHRALIDDPELLEAISRAIREDRLTAEAAWDRELSAVADRYREAGNPVLRSRAADVEDVRDRVLRALVGAGEAGELRLERPGVLIAQELTPSQTARLNREMVQAICTAAGGATSHAAVLARSMDIPAVVGLGQDLLSVAEGTLLGVDGRRGVVAVEPDPSARAFLARERDAWLAEQKRQRDERHLPALTRDGRRVEVAANAGSVADARAAREAGAEGIGLLRTEFLFLDREDPPGEDEQAAVYRDIVEAVAPHPVIIRTLDVGGDKPPSYLAVGAEANPFLGLRGLRVSLAYPDLFRAQLRAILRAAAAGPVRVMFPMVSTAQELEAALEHLQAAREELRRAGRAEADAPLQVGIMVEVPSAALLADRLARRAEFFSIGTNDLTQYAMAAERGNARVARLSDPLHPAVLRLIAQVIAAAHRSGRWAGVCGEMAGDPVAVPVLVGLGVDELSMAPAAVPGAKAILRQIDSASARGLAEEALGAESAEEVRSLVQSRFGHLFVRS